MNYKIEFSEDAQKDIKKWKKSNPNSFKKLYKLLPELEEHPIFFVSLHHKTI